MTGHPWRLARRALRRLVLPLGLLASTRGVGAQSPADLFWEAEAPLAVLGGGRVPGQITGRPEVERPTSLASAERPLIRLDLHSATPILVAQGDETVACWQTEVFAQECVAPLSPQAGGSRWTVGVRNRTSRGAIEDREADLDYRLALDDDRRALAVAYAGRRGWVLGAGFSCDRLRAVASGASVAQALRLSDDTTQWPRLTATTQEWTLGASRTRGRWRYGAQYTALEPGVALAATRAGSGYSAPLSADGRALEAYAAFERDRDLFFLTGADARLQAQGTLLMGLASRGDLACSARDSMIGVGWRRASASRTTQVMADWRSTGFRTHDQGSVGPLPGLASPIHTFQGEARVDTVSLRSGLQWPLGGGWSARSGLSGHRSWVEGSYRLRKTRGLFQDPITLSEGAIENGALDMVALSLGVGYDSARWGCLLAGGGAYATVAGGLKGDGGGPGPGGEPRRFKPEPLLAFSVEYRF